MAYLSIDQKKALISGARLRKQVNGRNEYAKHIGYDTDHRGFGGIFIFRDGQRAFWGVNPDTMKLVDLGVPPPKPKR